MVMNRKAAIEMSMNTVITIVLAVVFLILGLTLIRNIYGFADTSMGTINTNLEKQMSQLFPDETTKIAVDNSGIASIRAGTQDFGYGVVAKTLDGSPIGNSRSALQYALELDKTAANNCYNNPKISKTAIVSWFGQKISADSSSLVYNNIDASNADTGYARISITIPAGTPICAQKVYIYFIDRTDNTTSKDLGFTSFTINVLRQSLI
jgi:hypothetical protein